MQELNKILARLSIVTATIVIMPGLYKLRGSISRYILVIIVFSRPLANLFPQIKLFCKIVCIRKWLGIFCWSAALAHVVGYFLFHEIPVGTILTNSAYWSFTTLLGRWMRAMIAMLIPYLTSNCFSMRKLGKYRKTLQRFTYLAFIATGIHIYFVHHNPTTLIIIALYILIYILAYKKNQWTTKN